MDELIDTFSWFDLNQLNDENSTNKFQANCLQMCPPKEMSFRERNGLLHLLELIDPNQWTIYKSLHHKGGNQRDCIQRSFTNNRKSVKQYQRSSAGKEMYQPEMIRPTIVLKQTVDYLLDDCLSQFLDYSSSSVEAFGPYYDFTFDRLRSIRQDMTIQRACDSNCLYILERCVEFYIYSHYIWIHISQLSSTDNKNLAQKYFDAYLNQTHLQNSFHLLIAYYDIFNDILWSRRRPQFESLFMLYNLLPNLDNNTFKRYRKLKMNSFTCDLLNHGQIKIIKLMIRNYLLGNHIRSLRIVREQSTKHELFCCLFYIVNMSHHHIEFLKSISLAYRSVTTTRLPLSTLAEWFCPSDSRSSIIHNNDNVQYIESLCLHYGIPVESNRVDYFDSDEKKSKPEKFALIKLRNISQWNKMDNSIKPTKWLPQLSFNHYGRFLQ